MAKKPLLLCILDGFGWVPQETYGNAIAAAKTPYFDKLFASCPYTTMKMRPLFRLCAQRKRTARPCT